MFRHTLSVICSASRLTHTPCITRQLPVSSALLSPGFQPSRASSNQADRMGSAQTLEATACGIDELKDGEMKEVEIGEGKALVVRDNGQYYAVGHKCSHYGAPLIKGALGNGRVRCPWHGACFNYKTGDIEDFPGLDSIPKFQVSTKNGKVVVKANKDALANFRRVKTMCKMDKKNKDVYLIVGGGPAALACAETLRQEGFNGRVVMATKESHLPYDRPKLSKALSSQADAIALRKRDFFTEHDIEVQTGKEAVGVDTKASSVSFADGSSINYTKLVLATGSVPRVLPLPGVDLQNVCTLRTPEDAGFIAEHGNGKNVVVIGGSFIGMEVAAAMAKTAASVTVLDIVSVPFERALGKQVGEAILKLHTDAGVKFIGEMGIKEISGTEGRADSVVLNDGTKLPADLVVMGTGVAAATGFLKDSGLEMNKFGQIGVNKNLQTNVESIYAAGDIVEFPLSMLGGQPVNIGHWQIAHSHGRTAALNMVGKPTDFDSVPFFWTMMFGKSLRYAGYGPGYEDVILHGSPADLKFVAYYTKGENVQAVASLNYDPLVAEVAEVMASGRTIKKADILNDPRGWA